MLGLPVKVKGIGVQGFRGLGVSLNLKPKTLNPKNPKP